MSPEKAIELVTTELRRAEAKHPGWPADRLRQVVIIAEEAGEALRAALTIIETEEKMVGVDASGKDNGTWRGDPYEITLSYNKMARLEEELEAEVVQTAAMALRWLLNRKPLYAEDRPES
jgi:hypothetical protein